MPEKKIESIRKSILGEELSSRFESHINLSHEPDELGELRFQIVKGMLDEFPRLRQNSRKQ